MPKLLLVEDDNNLREIYAARMQAEGYEVVTAADGEEALVTGKAEKPDLIISDVMMPKISGFEMLDIIRNTEGMRDVKIIMLTALGQSDEQERADKLGADKYLVKSQVTLEDIVNAAHELLGDKPDAAAQPGTTPAAPEVVPTATDTAAPAPEAAVTPEVAPAPQTPASTPEETIPTPEATASHVPEPAPEATTSTPETIPTATDTAAPAPEAAATEGIAAVVPGASESASTPQDANTTATGDSQALTSAVDSLLETAPTSESSAPVTDENSTSNGMKVIDPIQTEPTKDINELLAEEEASNASVPEAAPAVPAPETAAETPAPDVTPATTETTPTEPTPTPEETASPVPETAPEATTSTPETAPAPENPTPKIDPNSAL